MRSNCDLLEAVAKTSSQPVMIKAYNVSRMTAALRERRQREVDLLQMVAAARVPNVMRFVGTVDDEHQACTIVERSSGANDGWLEHIVLQACDAARCSVAVILTMFWCWFMVEATSWVSLYNMDMIFARRSDLD